ncbi:amino acid permease [Gulosibacter faecalis]|jgi:GABA permease|uniref:Amino acid permease n=1 Tax=Gulosibacter faecalis TaxID=272240 RepID=A0ABW5UV94_9MICO|nr:amino acid permease [Gulosibacter faecalis]
MTSSPSTASIPVTDGAAGTDAAPSKKLRNRHVTMITLGGIIGSSLFVGSANVISQVGPAALFSYAIGGLLVMLAMRMLGEMATARPTIGSFMEYARSGLGEWAGYLVGWLYWYFWVGVVAYEAVIGGAILHGWFNAVPSWVFAIALLVVFIATNLVSLRSFGEVEFWLASVKVAAIIVFIALGALFIFGIWPNSTPGISHLWDVGGFAPNGVWPIISGVAIVIFSYFGTEIAVMAAAESEDPVRGVRQATNTIVWRILLFYVGSVFLIVSIVPWNGLPDPDQQGPFAFLFSRYGIPGADLFMTAVILTAVCSVLNSGIYSASRMFASIAERGFAPKLVARKAKNGVPVVAVIASTLGGFVAVLVSFLFPDSGIFDFIMNSSGLVALFVYAFIALTQVRLRNKMSAEERAGLQLKMWLHPWLAYATVAAVVGIVVIMLVSGPSTQVQVGTSLVSVAVLVVVWPFVRRNLKKSGQYGKPITEAIEREA